MRLLAALCALWLPGSARPEPSTDLQAPGASPVLLDLQAMVQTFQKRGDDNKGYNRDDGKVHWCGSNRRQDQYIPAIEAYNEYWRNVTRAVMSDAGFSSKIGVTVHQIDPEKIFRSGAQKYTDRPCAVCLRNLLQDVQNQCYDYCEGRVRKTHQALLALSKDKIHEIANMQGGKPLPRLDQMADHADVVINQAFYYMANCATCTRGPLKKYTNCFSGYGWGNGLEEEIRELTSRLGRMKFAHVYLEGVDVEPWSETREELWPPDGRRRRWTNRRRTYVAEPKPFRKWPATLYRDTNHGAGSLLLNTSGRLLFSALKVPDASSEED